MVIPVEWESGLAFDEGGLALIERDRRIGAINPTGEVVVEPFWEGMAGFGPHGLSLVYRDSVILWVDREGKMLIPETWGTTDNGQLEEPIDWLQRNGKQVYPDGEFTVDGFDQFGLATLIGEETYTVIDLRGKEVFTVNGRLSQFDSNGITLHRVGNDPNYFAKGFLDTKGRPVIQLADGPRWKSFRHDFMFRHAVPDFGDFYVVGADVDPTWLRSRWSALMAWIKDDDSLRIDKDWLCLCYDKDGTLIWSSQWIRFETKCHMAIALCLMVAFIARPRKKARVAEN